MTYNGDSMDTVVRERIVNAVKDRFSGDSGGHDADHTFRVVSNALRIWEKEGGDRDIVELAAMLHDVDDRKLFGGDPYLCEHARIIMGEDFSDDVKDSVCDIIRRISFKGKDTEIPESLEGRIVQDADRLDAIGAIGIARAFAYGGSKGRKMYDPADRPKLDMSEEQYFANTGTTVNHFYEKLLLLKDMMNTDAGMAMAKHRHDVMESFLEEFYDEWGQ